MATGAHGSTTYTSPKQHKISQLVQMLDKCTKPLQDFAKKFGNDWCMTFSGVLAYSLLMAMLPIAIAMISILGFALGSANTTAIVHKVSSIFPSLAGQQNTIDLAINQLSKEAGILAIIAVLLAIFGGSRLFITIEGCLDIVYRVRPRSFIPQNLMAFGMFVLFIILVPIMVFTSAAPSFILNFLGVHPIFKNILFVHQAITNPIMLQVAALAGGLIAAFILFEAIYFIVPNQKISWKNSWKGALAAAIALEIFLNLFPLYTQYFLKNYAGQIGFAVILLLFFYYFAVILMLGGEVNAFFFEHVRPIPNDLPTFVSAMAGKLNQDILDTELQDYKDIKPTENKDEARIADIRKGEEEQLQHNKKKQAEIASKNLLQHQEGQHKQAKKVDTSRRWSLLAVTFGSILTVVLEFLQLRRKDH